MKRKQLIALENFALVVNASKRGLKIFPEDMLINYAEIDHRLKDLEEEGAASMLSVMTAAFLSWASRIKSKDDLSRSLLDLDRGFQRAFYAYMLRVWGYGQETADQELRRIEVQEFAGGVGRADTPNNDDAYEWYDLYARAISKHETKAAFTYMQPLILEHIDKGTFGTELAAALEVDFRRYGIVRTNIIARTETNKAFNWGRRYRFDASKAIAGYRYSAILDERTTDICTFLHGHSWEIDDPELNLYTPSNHYQCRSIIVPISKYVTFTFKPSGESWEADLPDAEYKVLQKFKDSSFYPKRETVEAMKKPNLDPPKQKASTNRLTPPEMALGPEDTEKAISEMIAASQKDILSQIRKSIDHNISRGIDPDHPVLLDAQQTADMIKSGAYEGQMIKADFNARKQKYEIYTYNRLGNLFVRTKAGVKAADRDRALAEIAQVANNPLFAGVAIDIIKSKTKYGSYQAETDRMTYSIDAGRSSKRTKRESGQLGTLYHEIGHRVHNTDAEMLAYFNMNINQILWDEWKDTVDPYYEAGFTQRGSDFLPEDLYYRYDYPVNAKQYYKRGSKNNFYKEMFAESMAVYLEGDEEVIEKVDRTYPGVIGFFEKILSMGRKRR